MPITSLEGEESSLGLYLTDQLTTALTGASETIAIVERAKINDVLREFKIGSSGILSQETIQKLGRALGADAVVVGTVTDLGEDVDATVRVTEVESLKALAKASALIQKNDNIESMLSARATSNRGGEGSSLQKQFGGKGGRKISDSEYVALGFAAARQQMRIGATAEPPTPIGRFPAGGTVTIRATGKVNYGGGWVDPPGNLQHLMGIDPGRGRHREVPHGALCLLIPPDSSIVGFVPPSEVVQLDLKRQRGDVWVATIKVTRDNDLALWIADSGHGNNAGYFEVTVEWSPPGPPE